MPLQLPWHSRSHPPYRNDQGPHKPCTCAFDPPGLSSPPPSPPSVHPWRHHQAEAEAQQLQREEHTKSSHNLNQHKQCTAVKWNHLRHPVLQPHHHSCQCPQDNGASSFLQLEVVLANKPRLLAHVEVVVGVKGSVPLTILYPSSILQLKTNEKWPPQTMHNHTTTMLLT